MLDVTDRRMIGVLRQDGRISNIKLAETVGLSPSACLRRLQALEASGTIRGYMAIVNDPGPDDAVIVIVQITLDRQTEDFMKRFETAVRRISEVRECYLMTGMTDYLLRVQCRNMADYERVHTEVLSRLPGVARIQSSFTIRNVIREARG